jgi:lipoprotein-anchoring transpeptidase ErfK/SrfK
MTKRQLRIELAQQRLICLEQGRTTALYPVSTARAGAGEILESGCTPRGWHRIHLKVGEGCPENTVFIARRPTGEIYQDELAAAEPERDWILTRILWLTGCEPGFNQGGRVDTLRRYIYIHGTPEESLIGMPVSHGCIRMRNRDLLKLFDWVDVGTPVEIVE